MTENIWAAAKRRAGLVGAFFVAIGVETVRNVFYLNETEPFRRRWWRRKPDRE